MTKLTSMINIGKEMEKKLMSIDICSVEELKQIGSKEAFFRLKLRYSNLCLVHLYTLQGVIDNIRYSQLPYEIKQRGNGLSIKNKKGRQSMKASDFDRSISYKNMLASFGEFQTSKTPTTAKDWYKKKPLLNVYDKPFTYSITRNGSIVFKLDNGEKIIDKGLQVQSTKNAEDLAEKYKYEKLGLSHKLEEKLQLEKKQERTQPQGQTSMQEQTQTQEQTRTQEKSQTQERTQKQEKSQGLSR